VVVDGPALVFWPALVALVGWRDVSALHVSEAVAMLPLGAQLVGALDPKAFVPTQQHHDES